MSKYKQRADGRYYTAVRTGELDSNGKPISVGIYAASSRELEALVAEARQKRSQNKLHIKHVYTLSAYSERWLTITKASRSLNTQRMYRKLIDNHLDGLGNRCVSDITRADIQEHVNDMSSMPRTCEQMLVMLRQVFAMAVDEDLVAKSPCGRIELPRKSVKEKRALTDEERKAVVSVVLPPQHRALLDVLYYCGLRPAEAYALTWEDIDCERHEVYISKALVFDGEQPVVSYPKTDKGRRHVQAPVRLFKTFLSLRDISVYPIIFCDDIGAYRKKSAYGRMFATIKRNIEKYLGRKTDLTAYTFRHSYASTLYYSGISVKEAVRLMGHSDTRMLMEVYAHLDAKKENTQKKLEKIFSD